MREHVKADEPFVREDVAAARGARALRGEDQDYKVELIEDLVERTAASSTVSLYTNGPFTDLCRGPHAPSHQAHQGVQAAVRRRRLLARRRRPHDAHAHLRDGLPLQGRARASTCERLEEARARDHRKLGRELELFMFSELSARARRSGSRTGWRSGTSSTRAVARGERSRAATARSRRRSSTTSSCGSSPGHWDKYRENMYFTRRRGPPDGPEAHELPGARPDLQATSGAPTATCRSATPRPGLVHRHEPSGTLHGLLRVRHITQDDAHIFCTEEQIEEEVIGCLRLRLRDLRHVRLRAAARALDAAGASGSAPRRCGTAPRRRSQRALERARPRVRAQRGRRRVLRAEDRPAHDRLDRPLVAARHRAARLHRCPSASTSTYTGADNAEHRPVMIHRALMGSFERFIGILIEHYARRVPALARARPGARAADRRPPQRLRARGRGRAAAPPALRVEVDDRTESVGRKIREAELRKVPYMLVVGDREAERARRRAAPPPRGRPRARCRSTRPSRGSRARRPSAEQLDPARGMRPGLAGRRPRWAVCDPAVRRVTSPCGVRRRPHASGLARARHPATPMPSMRSVEEAGGGSRGGLQAAGAAGQRRPS